MGQWPRWGIKLPTKRGMATKATRLLHLSLKWPQQCY